MRSQFTQWLRSYRLVHGLSVADASGLAGIGAPTWRHYEAGSKPGSEGLSHLSEYFGCSVAKLERMAQTPADADLFDKAAIAAVEAVFAGLGV